MLFSSFLLSFLKAQDSIPSLVFETSASGHKLTPITSFPEVNNYVNIRVSPIEKYQEITGFGGSFTQSTASLLLLLSEEKRRFILEAYFGESGARYSLTRTHINSCDFSQDHYSFAPVEDDRELKYFSIAEDRKHILPIIQQAMALSKEGFKIIASPWTAPPWMKDNKDWRGGKLLPAYYDTWALFFSKYIEAYRAEGIDIWGITVENEPLGNGNNWESMHYNPEEMNHFVANHLGPRLQAAGLDINILGYDQNRDKEFITWVDAMYDDSKAANFYAGTAVHWYHSTYDFFPEALQYAHHKNPSKHLIHTEGCIDAQVPHWKEDGWYWSNMATDWGWKWAPEEDRYLHPAYTPVFRYARDIIGCLNNWVDGWIDWNMVLDRQGGPNTAKNWCVAPIIVDPEADDIYITPLYYILSHFSRYIRPGAVRVGISLTDSVLMATAVQNPDGSLVMILLNQSEEPKGVEINIANQKKRLVISEKAIQTILIPK